MKKIFYFLSSIISLVFPTKQAVATLVPEQYQSSVDSADRLAKHIQTKFSIPGMQITAMKDNKVIWSNTYGYRNLTLKLALKNYNKMRIASISKMFTSVGIMKLIEMNLINPDSTIQTYVPEFPEKKYQITIRHLLNHTSGIRHYNNDEFNNPKKYKTIEESLNYFKNDSLMFEPGTQVLYSSYAYNLLGVVIERIMKMPYKDFIYKYLLYPSTLKYTIPDQIGNFIKNKSFYYYFDDKEIIRNTYDYDMTFKLPTGGYLSTSYEITKFASELIEGKILNEQILKLYLSPTYLKNGESTFWNMGLKNSQIDNTTNVFWQMGSTYGGCSAVIFDPVSKLTVCWLNNMSVAWTEEEILQMMKYFLEGNKKIKN